MTDPTMTDPTESPPIQVDLDTPVAVAALDAIDHFIGAQQPNGSICLRTVAARIGCLEAYLGAMKQELVRHCQVPQGVPS